MRLRPCRLLLLSTLACLGNPSLGTAAPAPTQPAPTAPASTQPAPTAPASTQPAAAPQPEGPAAPPAATSPTREGPAREGPAQLPAPAEFPTTTAEEPRADAPLDLVRQRDGSYLYVDPGRRFTAAIDANGTVRFGNRWGRDQHGKRMRGSGAALRQVGPRGLTALGFQITGPTEWLLFLQGQEFDAAAKTEFLRRTRDVRTAIAIAFTRHLLDTRLSQLNHELMGLWTDDSRDLARRRAIVFQRWDECDEYLAHGLPSAPDLPPEAISEVDQARLAAADRARRTIEAFIRRQMPRGSARAYSAHELAEFNRKRISLESFTPYQPRDTAPATKDQR